MRITDLEPQFLMNIDGKSWQHVGDINDADGILFVCPKCLAESGERPGVHSILCWTPKVPQELSPGPGRWHLLGTGYNDLSLKGVSNDSVLLTGGCGAHFFVREGEIVGA